MNYLSDILEIIYPEYIFSIKEMNNIKIKWHKSIEEIPKIIWNNFQGKNSNPFYKWDWLNTLERSGSVSKKYGWQPLFLSAWSGKNLIACAPLYLKSHSYGEFIFDNAFVQLAQNMGLQYYPKLIGMSPLSPIAVSYTHLTLPTNREV